MSPPRDSGIVSGGRFCTTVVASLLIDGSFTTASLVTERRITMFPRSVYLQALVSRFSSICHSHSSSVITASLTSGATSKLTGTCLL
jgi:hypothetical protein